MSEKHEHEYDGIKEEDNPAPKWWQIIFYLSIAWGIGYIYYYNLYEGETLRHRLSRELTDIEIQKSKVAASGPTEEDLTKLVADPTAIKTGKDAFVSKCASCHGNSGEGLIGPNLTDAYWIHGKGKALDIFKTVDKGVPDKGMPPWGPILTPTELKAVVAYIVSIQGTKPANPKPPQGELVK